MEEEIKNWEEIGRLGKEVYDYAQSLIKKNVKALEIAEKIEEYVKSKGLKFSFPVNLSSDNMAAHFTPLYGDESIIGELVKLDMGLMKDGYICDMSKTFDLTDDKRYGKLILASKEALQNAINMIKEGVKLMDIGKTIEKTINSHGFSPVRNLCGHQLKRYVLHAGLSIPNYDNKDERKLEENQVIAVEPFATPGIGEVRDGGPSGIYNLVLKKPIRDSMSRKILKFIEYEYKTLPFSSRWIVKEFGQKAVFSLRLLEKEGILHHYTKLVEKSGKPVSQAEHTILVKKDSCKVLTG